jgi:hypothetical protein
MCDFFAWVLEGEVKEKDSVSFPLSRFLSFFLTLRRSPSFFCLSNSTKRGKKSRKEGIRKSTTAAAAAGRKHGNEDIEGDMGEQGSKKKFKTAERGSKKGSRGERARRKVAEMLRRKLLLGRNKGVGPARKAGPGKKVGRPRKAE